MSFCTLIQVTLNVGLMKTGRNLPRSRAGKSRGPRMQSPFFHVETREKQAALGQETDLFPAFQTYLQLVGILLNYEKVVFPPCSTRSFDR